MINSFNVLDLHAQIRKNISSKGYTQPTPVQALCIPHLLQRRDMMGCAQTGTGKTAAFALPLLHHLKEDSAPRRPNTARVLVLAPTRELAVQIAESFESYGEGLGLRVLQVFGGVGFGPQKAGLRKGVDILVACPGRLLDLQAQGYFQPDGIRYFVLDEADRMLDMGFAREVKKIAAGLTTDRQTLLFSATMPESVLTLARSLLRDPVEVSVDPTSSTAENVEQKLCWVNKGEKRELLRILLKGQSHDPDSRCLVFTRTKHGANRLVREMDRYGLRSSAIHGNKSQGARQRALEGFRDGTEPVLIATDVASRGIDVKGVSLVVNYDMPIEPEAYVHRIGRTARAGASGIAVSFCCEEEFKELRQIERTIRQEIPVDREQPLHSGDLESRYGSGQRSPAQQGKPSRGRSSRNGNFRKGNRSRRHQMQRAR